MKAEKERGDRGGTPGEGGVRNGRKEWNRRGQRDMKKVGMVIDGHVQRILLQNGIETVLQCGGKEERSYLIGKTF